MLSLGSPGGATMPQLPSLQDIVVETLAEMGLSTSSAVIRTLALQGGCLVAEKFRFDAGYAICPVGSDTIEFYDHGGKLLKTVRIGVARHKETAA
jgi:hypothetical protein